MIQEIALSSAPLIFTLILSHPLSPKRPGNTLEKYYMKYNVKKVLK